jgi:peptidoglycan/LPS O-acetylase OafA/YrhL
LFGLDYLTAVTLFFVISGFTLVHVYDTPGPKHPLDSWAEQKVFFWKRIARLAPIYYFSLFADFVPFIVYRDQRSIILSVPLSLLCLQSLVIDGTGWNSPVWTVSAFAFCYLFFPCILARSRLLSPRQLMWRIAWSSFASWASFLVVGLLCGQYGLLHAFAVFRLPHFLVGVFAGLCARKAPLPCPSRIAEACTLVLLVDQVLSAALGTGDPSFCAFYGILAEFALPPVFALWVAALSSPACASPTCALLCWRPTRLLGALSYSLFCLHQPLIEWCCWAAAGRGVSRDAVPAITSHGMLFFFSLPAWALLPVLAYCVAAAAAAHRLLEAPARRRLAGRLPPVVRPARRQDPSDPAELASGTTPLMSPSAAAAESDPTVGGPEPALQPPAPQF